MAERASSWFERSLGTRVSLLGLLSTFYSLTPLRSPEHLLNCSRFSSCRSRSRDSRHCKAGDGIAWRNAPYVRSRG